MENNQQPQNAQDVVPSLDSILGGEQQTQGSVFDDLANSLDNGAPEGGGEATDQQGSPAGDPPATPPTGDPVPPIVSDTNQASNEDDLVKLLSTDDNLLSADDREFKVSVYEKFQAVGVDFKGNLLNANGEVVLSSDDFDNYIDTGAIPLDADGNQVNAKGEIIADASSVEDSLNMIDLTKKFVESDFGYEFKDEEGKPRSYANTVEGNQEFVKDVAVAAQVSAVSSFLASKPELREVFYHLENGGKLEDFVQNRVDYTSIDVTELSKDQKLAYIKQSYEKQGVKNVNSIMNLLDSVGDEKITQSAAEAILSLKEVTDAEASENEKRYQQQQIADQENANKYWNDIKSVIDKGDLQNLRISNDDKSDFYKYIAEPINAKGETREMLDAAKETSESQLLISYLRYKGGDISKLINNKAKLNRVEALRERLGKNIPIPNISNSRERQSTQRGGAYVPNITDILG